MKRYGALIALVLAVGFGLMAVILANKWLSARSQQITVAEKETISTVRVVVASRDLDMGTPLSPEHLSLIEWPKGSVPKNAFHDIEAVKGRTILAKLWAGEPVLAPTLAAPGSGAGMVAVISPGMRAMAVRVDEMSGVGGFILPNTFVDIIAVDQDRNRMAKADTLLERIKVLAIAQETFTEDGKPKLVKTVTLELKPKDAEKVAKQIHDGSIHLVLRNPLDEEPPEAEPPPKIVTRKGPVRTVYVTKPALKPTTFEVEVIRRAKRESLNFPGENSEEKL